MMTQHTPTAMVPVSGPCKLRRYAELARARIAGAQPGDIAERCRSIMHPVEAARRQIDWWERYRGTYPTWLTR